MKLKKNLIMRGLNIAWRLALRLVNSYIRETNIEDYGHQSRGFVYNKGFLKAQNRSVTIHIAVIVIHSEE